MVVPTSEEIASKIRYSLAPTGFACSTLTPLLGGTTNFIFKGQLLKPRDDGTTQVVIKHGEDYSASRSDLSLSTNRCVSAAENPKRLEWLDCLRTRE